MSGLRWVVLVSVLVLAAAAGAVAMTSRGEEQESAGDPDRDAEAHVASRPGYEQRNAVKVFATAAAAGWAGEAKLAVEDTWEPHVAADPERAVRLCGLQPLRRRLSKSSCPNPQMLIRVSGDGGATWGRVHPAVCMHQSQRPVGSGRSPHGGRCWRPG
jgi:hypothetical protein